MSESILTSSGLDVPALARISEPPELYERSVISFWQDPYVSSHVLDAHLNPGSDAASHPPDIIDSRINWLCARCGLEPGSRVLDLGSGPGLYCERFASLGMEVSGIDFSPAAYSYAVEKSSKERLPINYQFGSFTELDFAGPYDLITLIYGDFCTLTEEERSVVMRKVRSSLGPTGFFAFDVFTRLYLDGRPGSPGWYVSIEDGFWRPSEHLVLEQRLEYKENHVLLDRYLVVDETGEIADFRVWNTYFTEDLVSSIAVEAGFRIEELIGDLSGAELSSDPAWIAILATPT